MVKIKSVQLSEVPSWYPFARIEAAQGIEIWRDGGDIHVRFTAPRYARLGHIVLGPHGWVCVQVEDEAEKPAARKAG